MWETISTEAINIFIDKYRAGEIAADRDNGISYILATRELATR